MRTRQCKMIQYSISIPYLQADLQVGIVCKQLLRNPYLYFAGIQYAIRLHNVVCILFRGVREPYS